MAQRPWIRVSDLPEGASDRLRLVANSLHAFGSRPLRSFDQGVTWDTISTLPGNVFGMAAFQTAGVSIAMAQPVQPGLIRGYFTQSGTSWTPFDSIDVGNDIGVDVETLGDNYIIGLNTNKIVVRGDEISIITVAAASGSQILDVATTSTAIVLSTTKGIFISKTLGESWERVDPPLDQPTEVTAYPLRTINGMVYGATAEGVKVLNTDASSWSDVGTWPDSVGRQKVIDIAGDENRIVAMTVHQDTAQMYRLESGREEWIVTAYPLPGIEPAPSANSLVIDAGWAVTAHHSAAEPDSSAVYRYNLNDFTSVGEAADDERVAVRMGSDALFIEQPWPMATCTVFDLSGRELFRKDLSSPQSIIPTSHLPGRLFIICVHSSASNEQATRIVVR